MVKLLRDKNYLFAVSNSNQLCNKIFY